MAGDIDEQIAALRQEAQALDEAGRTVEALPIQRQAVELAASGANNETEVIQRERLMFYLYRCGLSSEALDEMDKAAELCMKSPMHFLVTLQLADTSTNIMDELGELESALTIIETSTSGARQAVAEGNDAINRPLAALLDKQASLQHRVGQYDEAVTSHREALLIWKSLDDNNIDDRVSLAKSLHGLALSLVVSKQLQEANESLYEALQLMRKVITDDIRYSYEFAPLLMSLGNFYELYNQLDHATSAMTEAVDIYRGLYGNRPLQYSERLANALQRLSDLESTHDPEQAMSHQDECVDLLRDVASRDISRRIKLADALVLLAQRQLACDNLIPARNNIDEAIEIYEFLTEEPSVEMRLVQALETREAINSN